MSPIQIKLCRVIQKGLTYFYLPSVIIVWAAHHELADVFVQRVLVEPHWAHESDMGSLKSKGKLWMTSQHCKLVKYAHYTKTVVYFSS